MNLYTPTIIGNSLVSGSMYGSNARYSGSFSGSFSGISSGTFVGIGSGSFSGSFRGDGSLLTSISSSIPTLQMVTTAGSTTTNQITISNDGVVGLSAASGGLKIIGNNGYNFSFENTGSTANRSFRMPDASGIIKLNDGLYSGSFSGSFIGNGSGLTGISSTTPTLQQVTDTGSSTTNSITVGSIAIRDFSDTLVGGIYGEDFGGVVYLTSLNETGFLGEIKSVASGFTASRLFRLPDESGTIQVRPNYKIYSAFLSQVGTSAPTATVFENTLGSSLVWGRSSAGVFSGAAATGSFTSEKTAFIPTVHFTPSSVVRVVGEARTTYSFNLYCYNTIDVATDMSDDRVVFIEIRVYP